MLELILVIFLVDQTIKETGKTLKHLHLYFQFGTSIQQYLKFQVKNEERRLLERVQLLQSTAGLFLSYSNSS